MKATLSIIVLLLLMTACNENRVFKEYQDLSPNLEWKKSDSKTFKFAITEEAEYDLTLGMRYVTGYGYDVAKVQVILIDEEELINKIYDINIGDKEGNYIGEPGLDLWDVEQKIETLSLAPGEYILKAIHAMPDDPFLNVMELGVIVDKK